MVDPDPEDPSCPEQLITSFVGATDDDFTVTVFASDGTNPQVSWTFSVELYNELPNPQMITTRNGDTSADWIRLDGTGSLDPEGDEIRYELKNIFFQEDLSCKVEGRIKTPYSIWNKIKNKNISFEQLSDIMAFRVITNSTRECYRCLGIIHRQYPYIQGRFKDFISAPKSNGYRALHTSVMGPKNKKIEIQFRSNIMDQIADFGVASHWKYNCLLYTSPSPRDS